MGRIRIFQNSEGSDSMSSLVVSTANSSLTPLPFLYGFCGNLTKTRFMIFQQYFSGIFELAGGATRRFWELISSLKSSFRDSEFSKVESVIVAREARLKREIMLLEERHEWEMELCKMEKLELENELKEYKKRCSELERRNSQLREEKDITNERERSSADRWKELLEELESDKRKAESTAEIWKRKYEKLDTRIQKVEEDLQSLMDMEPKIEVASENGERIEINNTTRDVNIGGYECDREESMDMAREEYCPMGEGSGRPPTGSIIEIIDSDDDCASGGHLLSGQTNMQNGTGNLEGNYYASLNLNAKQTNDDTCGNDKTDEGQYPGGDCKRKRLQISDSSSNPFSLGNDIFKKIHTPLNEDLAFSRPCQDKFWGKPNCWYSSSSSSSSDSDDDVNQCDKKWETISDMIDAFDKDNKLYLEAVCALYRQHISLHKSPRSLSSLCAGGFVPQYEFRGTTLAKFLTDEDPQGKLKKSVAELLHHDPAGLDDCKKIVIAQSHSQRLYNMYLKKEDLLFQS